MIPRCARHGTHYWKTNCAECAECRERVRRQMLLDRIEELEAAVRDAIKALGPGDDEHGDSPGNMAHAILASAVD